MSFFPDLPLISDEARPDFTDAASCTEWLRSLPLINVAPSHGRLLGELEELNCFDMPAAERIKVLEQMLDAVQFLQTEHAKKITNRAAPLSKGEREILLNIDALWNALRQGYVRALQAFIQADPEMPAKPGSMLFACQRALWCTQRKMAELYKCCRQPSPEDWKLLHALYAFAEERGCADEGIAHPVRGADWKTSCMELYAQAVLLDLANPNELTPRQLGLAARWLERFAIKARVVRSRPGGTEPRQGASIWIDLASSRGATRLEQPAGAKPECLRYLDTTEVGRSLRRRLAALKQGEAPVDIGLGDDVPAQAAEILLTVLHRLLCDERPVRAPGRRGKLAKAALAAGMGGIHFFISGRPFKQPGIAKPKELSQTEHAEIAMFGRMSTRRDDDYVTQQGFAMETWSIVDESPGGSRLRRDSGDARYVHAQLVALRPADAGFFTLAVAQWLAVDDGYVLDMGVRNIPGLPQPVAIRPTGLNAMSEKFVPGLALPAVAALQQPATLVLPAGWYKPKRAIEMFIDKPQSVLLTGVLERGSDFERVTFQPF